MRAPAFLESVLDEMPSEYLDHLQVTLSTTAFGELCSRHVAVFTSEITGLNRGNFETLDDFYAEFARLQNLLDFWNGLAELCPALKNRQ